MKRKKTAFILCFALLFCAGNVFAANYPAYRMFLRGVMSSKAGFLDLAIKDYEKVVAADSENALAVYKDLIYLYWQTGNSVKASELAEKVYEIDGKDYKTTSFLATFYLIANDPVKAKNYWEKTLELDPENEMATVYLAAYYYSDNKLQESADYWNKYLKQQPDSSEGYLQLGMVQEKLGMNAEALESYNKVISLNPDAREAYIAKARVFESMGKIDLAIKEYEDYVAVFPDNAYVLMYLGKSYYESNKYEKALDSFLKAKKSLPGDTTVRYWLGVVYEKLGDIDKAAEEFEYVASKENTVSILARLGYQYSLMAQYQKAEKNMLKALSKEPYNFEVMYLLGLNYLDWKKYDKAIEFFIKTIELNPGFPEAYFFMGSAYEKSGDFETAEKAFLKTVELDPEHTRALNYLGYTYADKNIKLEEAEILLTRAVTLEPQNGAYLDSLGWLYFRQGKYEEAKKFIVTAANITRDPLIYDHLGDVYVELGDLGNAWIAYSLSYDIGGEKSVKKKFDMVWNKLSKEELYGRTLVRADNNFKRLFSLKAGYKMNAGIGPYTANGYFPFSYIKGEGVSIEVPAGFATGGAEIYIKDGKTKFSPKAVEDSIPDEFSVLLELAAEVFQEDFFKNFEHAEISVKGGSITYALWNLSITVDLKTGLLKKIVKDNDIAVDIRKNSKVFGSYIPSKISVSSKKLKLRANFEAGKFSFAKELAGTPQSGEDS